MEKALWSNKPICPKCRSTDEIRNYKPRKHGYYCNKCRRAFTIRTDTVMNGSSLPISCWAIGLYSVLTARKGVSNLQLSKELGITQKSAWFMLQRIREACKQGDFKLSGTVEIDETYIGRKGSNNHSHKKLKAGRGTIGKAAILGMRQRKRKVKVMLIGNTDRHTLQTAIYSNVDIGSQLYTDEHCGHTDLNGNSYKHNTVKHSAKEYVNGMVHTNGIESVWAVLKRGYNGTFHNISTKHLSRYVDEFAFRLNEGNVKIDTIDRMVSLAKAMKGKRLRYKKLVL